MEPRTSLGAIVLTLAIAVAATAKDSPARRPYVPLFGLGSAPRGPDGRQNLPPDQLEAIARHFSTIDGLFTEADAKRLHELNAAIKLLPYLNSTYTSGSAEAAEYERTCRPAIAMWRAGVLADSISADATTLAVKDTGQGKFPFLTSTAKGDVTASAAEFVSWVRVGDELMKVTGIDPAGGNLQVVRGFDKTAPAAHAAASLVFAPVYIGSSVGTLGAGNGLPGRAPRNAVRYCLYPDNAEVWNRKAHAIIRHVQDGFDGAFLDILAPSFFNQGSALGQHVRPWNFAKSAPYSQYDWGTAQMMKINAFQQLTKEATGKQPCLVGNNMNRKYFDEEGGGRRYLFPTPEKPNPIQGMMSESPFSKPTAKDPFVAETAWRNSVQELMDAGQNKLAALPYCKTGGESDTAARNATIERIELHDYCSFLLAYEPDSPMQFAMPIFAGSRRGARTVNLPDHLFVNLGTPQDRVPYPQLDKYKHPGEHTYRRRYSGGIVLVNPSDRDDASIAIDAEYRDYKTHEPVRTLSVPAHSARLLTTIP